MRQILNQHSFVLIAVVMLGLLWLLVRRRSRWLRRITIGAALAGLVVFGVGARTGPGDVRGTGDLDTALAAGHPVVLEFFSNY
jgi:hypothetical protein